MEFAKSERSQQAIRIIQGLQTRFVRALEHTGNSFETPTPFDKIAWVRSGGDFGGGHRYVSGDNEIFNRAAVNYSHVHYESDFDKPLNAATAISTIIHPEHPLAPSVHMHYSLTELKDGSSYWRVMADLNPSNEVNADKKKFISSMQEAAGAHYQEGSAQGDKYFMIPALERTRGVAHFYLEGFSTGDTQADAAYVENFGQTMIDCYAEILQQALETRPEASAAEKQQQLDYHTLYLFQVLTLDRGTTSGLLVHNENDVGIMGSIPRRINRDLLTSWIAKAPLPHKILVQQLVDALPEQSVVEINDAEKQALADVVRAHFKGNTEALDAQAKGNVIPPTVANHLRA